MRDFALLFSGGGAHYVGMGKNLLLEHPAAMKVFDTASDIVGTDLKTLCFNGPLSTLSQMKYSQPAIFVTSIAMVEVFRDITGYHPRFVAGHSLGEYAALVYSGAMDLESGIRLINKRGELLQEVASQGNFCMMAINKIGYQELQNACGDLRDDASPAYIAVFNSPKQHVVSGSLKTLRKLEASVARLGGEAVMLDISCPSHCPLMSSVVDQFAAYLEQFHFKPFGVPVLSNVHGYPYELDAHYVRKTLTDHFVKPVRWEESIRHMIAYGVKHFIEIGPQSILKNLCRHIYTDASAYAIDCPEDISAIRATVSSKVVERSLCCAATMRNRNFDERSYRASVAEPYKTLSDLRGGISGPSSDAKAIALVTQILEGKKVPFNEIELLITQIKS